MTERAIVPCEAIVNAEQPVVLSRDISFGELGTVNAVFIASKALAELMKEGHSRPLSNRET